MKKILSFKFEQAFGTLNNQAFYSVTYQSEEKIDRGCGDIIDFGNYNNISSADCPEIHYEEFEDSFTIFVRGHHYQDDNMRWFIDLNLEHLLNELNKIENSDI
jgi:hypothetical protein